MCHQLPVLLEDTSDLGDVVSLLDTQFYCVTHTGEQEPVTCTESSHHVYQRLPCLGGNTKSLDCDNTNEYYQNQDF